MKNDKSLINDSFCVRGVSMDSFFTPEFIENDRKLISSQLLKRFPEGSMPLISLYELVTSHGYEMFPLSSSDDSNIIGTFSYKKGENPKIGIMLVEAEERWDPGYWSPKGKSGRSVALSNAEFEETAYRLSRKTIDAKTNHFALAYFLGLIRIAHRVNGLEELKVQLIGDDPEVRTIYGGLPYYFALKLMISDNDFQIALADGQSSQLEDKFCVTSTILQDRLALYDQEKGKTPGENSECLGSRDTGSYRKSFPN